MQHAIPLTPSQTRPSAWPWVALFGRSGLVLALQALFAVAFWLDGTPAAWEAAAGWWPLAVILTNLVCLWALRAWFRAEGKNFWSIFRIQREHLKGDLLVLLGFLVIAGPLGYLPNVLLAGWLWGDPEGALALFVQPLPLWMAYTAAVVFPLTQGPAELPLYFAYVMPRLEAQGLGRWLAVGLASLALALQHVAIPLLFDGRFIVWRALMFLPFALLTGLLLRWRPRLLPYTAIIHVLINLTMAPFFLAGA